MKQALLIIATVSFALVFKKNHSTENVLFIKDGISVTTPVPVAAAPVTLHIGSGLTAPAYSAAIAEGEEKGTARNLNYRACTMMACYYQ